MAAPNALILSGYGINCERETAHAFELTGSNPKIVHINDLIDGHDSLGNYQILVFPGGFSYGDDTGSGKAFANRMRNNHWEELLKFAKEDKLILGICNGFQILTNLGLLSGLDGNYGNRAGIAGESGRIRGMMPHPERAIFFTQRPDWPLKNELMKRKGEPIPRYNNDNLRFFENAAKYF